MKPINKDALSRTIIIALLSSWLSWVCIWPSACTKKDPLVKIQQQSQLMLAEHAQIVSRYKRQQVESLKINDSLQRQLAETKKALIKYRQKSSSAKTGVLYHVNHDSKDTITMLSHCDSLKTMVAQYVQIVQDEDSVQQKTITELEVLVGERDTALIHCEGAYTQMVQLSSKSIQQQAELENELDLANWKLERRGRVIRVLSGVSVGLAGVTALVLSW